MRIGQVAFVGGPKVRPVRIVEDSRCPRDTQCVWAGRVIVQAIVSGGSWSREIDLTLGKPVMVADGQLTLTEVTPDRPVGLLKPARYRFSFLFQGGL